jgi:hypothetical protein
MMFVSNDQRPNGGTIERQSGSMVNHVEPSSVTDGASKCRIVRGDVAESSVAYELTNVVETAPARALVLAAEAKRWDVVAQITEELRRRESAPPKTFAPLMHMKRS